MVVDHWRAYLQQGEFILRTDQKSLIHLDDQRITSPWKQNVLRKLMGLNFQIVYKKKGSGNKIADVLSCVHHIAITELAAMFFAQPSQLSDLHNFYTTDPTTSILLAELALHSPLDQYTLLNGIIRYKQRICLDILPTFSTIKWYYLLQTMHLLGTFYPPSACIPLSLTFQ